MVVMVALSVTPAGCGGDEGELTLPSVPPVREYPEWALVTFPYARLHAGPERSSAIVGHVRSGEVVRIVGRRASVEREQDRTVRWLRVAREGQDEAWISDREADLFDTQAQAERAREVHYP